MNPFTMTEEQRAARKLEHYNRYAPDRALEKEFFEHVKNHKLVVSLDNGVHRHITLKQPGTTNRQFHLVTFPGYLCYTGDMGSFVFTRLEDMFEFFREKPDHHMVELGLKLYTNHSYWSEKLCASDCSGRHEGKSTEFDADRFKARILEYLRDWIKTSREEGTLDKEERRELWEAVHEQVIEKVDDYGENAQTMAYEFSWSPFQKFGQDKRPRFYFQDLFESNFQQYTYSFKWACLAIAWGITQYDAWKDEQKKAAAKKDAFDSLPDDFEVN